jgi:hypothetical protein
MIVSPVLIQIGMLVYSFTIFLFIFLFRRLRAWFRLGSAQCDFKPIDAVCLIGRLAAI